MGGQAHTRKSTSGIVVNILGTLVIWKSNKERVVAQSRLQAEMIATAYSNVQIDWLHNLTSEIGNWSRGIARRILNEGRKCVTTLNSGNFQSDSRHLRLRYHSIHEAIGQGDIELKHVAGMEMPAKALSNTLWAVKFGEFVEEIGLG
jgi:hypothetical protein